MSALPVTALATSPAVLAAVTSASEIRISGTVQGVGFRPTVWRLAREEGLVGEVLNDGDGVLIRTVGDADAITRLVHRIRSEAPILSRIESMHLTPLPSPPVFRDFRIVESVGGENRTRIAADAAVCAQCHSEVLDASARRHGYPFTNCTHCGPRFSIVLSVPYDRPRTSMADFPMCEACRAEYTDPADRRFHAQPIACAVCGPKLWIEHHGAAVSTPSADVIADAAEHLRSGRIVALRGLGGFHLVCDAGNADAVQRLRERKHRYAKPLAVMARSIEMVRRYASVSPRAAELLASPEAPIVLLNADGMERLPDAIAPQLDMLGFMLPYTPMHVLLMELLDRPVVMTSANLSSEPQVIDNEEAREKLSDIADLYVMHDRNIANRIDDSVLRIVAGRPRILRRARGYAPGAIPLPRGFDGAPDVLAYGAELKSTFCLLKNGAAILSQHQGDLEDVATFEDFQKNLRLYTEIYDHDPRILAADLHPEYLSTKLCHERVNASADALPLEQIQHHHAHMASCMAENGLPLDHPPVLGLVLDGLGLGDDGTFWGGELLLGGYASMRRVASLKPVAMMGGMQAIREPWRSTYAHLRAAFDWDEYTEKFGSLELHHQLQQKPLAMMDRMMAAQLNCPAASSCGRLFDAVAAAIGLCFDHAAYEGQGAMALEAAAARSGGGAGPDYSFRVIPPTPERIGQLDPAPMWRSLLQDLSIGTSQSTMAARFHRGLAQGLAELVNATLAALPSPRPDTVVLSGGCLQNAVLLEELLRRMRDWGLKTLSHEKVPANDGGISLGQAAIAAARQLSARRHPTHHSSGLHSIPQPERSTPCV